MPTRKDGRQGGPRRYRAKTREGMRVTTIALPEEMFRDLNHAAVDEDISMTEIVRRLVSEYLKERRGKGGKTG